MRSHQHTTHSAFDTRPTNNSASGRALFKWSGSCICHVFRRVNCVRWASISQPLAVYHPLFTSSGTPSTAILASAACVVLLVLCVSPLSLSLSPASASGRGAQTQRRHANVQLLYSSCCSCAVANIRPTSYRFRHWHSSSLR